MAEKREVYMNAMQQRIYYAHPKDTRVIASRRFGKTDGVLGPYIKRAAFSMPQGAGGWLGNSRRQLLTRTVPATMSAIGRFFGLVEGVHYWWGQPPAKLNIPRPIIKPKDWSQVISFCNGYVYHLISLATMGSANSLTLNNLAGDEVRFIKKQKLDAEVMPALSGITHPLADPRFSESNPYYKSTMFVTDAALSQRENWMEKEEDKCDIPIERGPFAGRTPRELQTELDAYADKVMRYNDLLRNAKKYGHNVRVMDKDQAEQIRMIASCMKEPRGVFKVLSAHPGVTKANLQQLIDFDILKPSEAELVLDYEYILTKEEHMELMIYSHDERLKRTWEKYEKRLDELRCNTFAFYRASTLDNIDLLGFDYVARMKRDLPPVIFAISILNLKKSRSNDGFYAKLDIENIHGYTPTDCPAIEQNIRLKVASRVIGGQEIRTDYATPDFDTLQNIKDCTLDGDVHDDLPLHIAFDWNANINWVVTGQVAHDAERGSDSLFVLSSFFTKNERKLVELLNDWDHYYAPHKTHCRQVNFYFDNTAKFRAYAVAGQEDFKDTVIRVLTEKRWMVNAIDMGRAMAHEAKFKYINECLGGLGFPFVRFNVENNEYLIVSMENAEVEQGYNGFRKCKAGEKLPEGDGSESGNKSGSPLETRTDGSDAFDSLFIGVKFFQNPMMGICLPKAG